MDIRRAAALLYAAVSVGVIAFQIALAAGAPWGAYAMGGAFPGQFPPALRVAALVQAALIAGMAAVVLSRAGLGACWMVSCRTLAGMGRRRVCGCQSRAQPDHTQRRRARHLGAGGVAAAGEQRGGGRQGIRRALLLIGRMRRQNLPLSGLGEGAGGEGIALALFSAPRPSPTPAARRNRACRSGADCRSRWCRSRTGSACRRG